MKDKIIFWLNADITTFGIAKFLQEKTSADFFAIIDITNRPKKFFQDQTLINFKKIWFYHDYVNMNHKKIDLYYLIAFEKKYYVNLWELACNDRILYQYNDYYKFERNEILSILEQECKLFENILDEVKPDFFITTETALRPHHLFHQMCKANRIKILMLNHANFENFCYISQDRHKMDHIKNLDQIEGQTFNFEQLQERLKSFRLSKQLSKFHRRHRDSKIKKIKAAFQLLFLSDNSNIKTHYTYFGRTKLQVLIKEITFSIKKIYREYFINKKLSYDITSNEQFIFLPLHQEPERSLLIAAPFYTNQIETIRYIVKSLPIEYKLYVKEHPTQGPARGWRKISDYKQILDIPNVKLLHPSVSSDEIMNKCSLVISVGGTSSFEAAFYQKPSIIFADMDYAILPSIYKINSLEELPKIIHTALRTKVDSVALSKYISILESNCFNFDYLDFQIKYHNHFYYSGNLVDVEISETKMKTFLETNKTTLELLVDEYIKKIKQHKKYTS